MMKKIFLGLIFIGLLAACTDEVMNELKSDTYDPKLTTDFWNQQIAENSELWKQALPYCQEHPLKVNCTNLQKAWTRYVANQRMMAGGGAGAAPQPLHPRFPLLRRRPHVIIVEE